MKFICLLGLSLLLAGCSSFYTLSPNDGPIWVADSQLGPDRVLYCTLKDSESPEPVCYSAEIVEGEMRIGKNQKKVRRSKKIRPSMEED